MSTRCQKQYTNSRECINIVHIEEDVSRGHSDIGAGSKSVPFTSIIQRILDRVECLFERDEVSLVDNLGSFARCVDDDEVVTDGKFNVPGSHASSLCRASSNVTIYGTVPTIMVTGYGVIVSYGNRKPVTMWIDRTGPAGHVW